jgi:hypothetical protein
MVGEEGLDVSGEFEETEHVGDGGAVLACALGDLLVAEVVLLIEAFEGVGDFDGVEIFALDVLDESDFHEAVVGEVLDDGGDMGERGEFGGTPASFTGDELVGIAGAADDDWLDDTVFADGLGEAAEAFGVKDAAGLEGIGVYFVEGEREGAGAGGGLRRGGGFLGDEAGESAAESLAAGIS